MVHLLYIVVDASMNPLPPRSSIAPAKPLGHFWHLFGTMAFGAPHARFRTARAAFRAAALARTTLGAAFESATVTFPKFVRRLRLVGHLQALASRTSCLSPDADCLTRNVSRPPWRSAALSHVDRRVAMASA